MAAARTPGAWTSLLDAVEVRTVLHRARALSAAHPVAEVGSTQDLALALASHGAQSGTVVVADRQLSGRGRVGRSWDDRPDGGTLALTVLLDVGSRTGPADASVGLVPHALGLAVLRACARIVPGTDGLALKWPNDVVHREARDAPPRKVAGVLVERERISRSGRARDVLLCGIGLNVDLAGAEGQDRVCLRGLTGVTPDRTTLLAALLSGVDETLVEVEAAPRAVIAAYRTVSDTIGRRIRVEAGGGILHEGLATDVDDVGRLLLTTDTGNHAILSGTVRDAVDRSEAAR